MDRILQSDHELFTKTENTVAFYLTNAMHVIKSVCPELIKDKAATAHLAGQLTRVAAADFSTGVLLKRLENLIDAIQSIIEETT